MRFRRRYGGALRVRYSLIDVICLTSLYSAEDLKAKGNRFSVYARSILSGHQKYIKKDGVVVGGHIPYQQLCLVTWKWRTKNEPRLAAA